MAIPRSRPIVLHKKFPLRTRRDRVLTRKIRLKLLTREIHAAKELVKTTKQQPLHPANRLVMTKMALIW